VIIMGLVDGSWGEVGSCGGLGQWLGGCLRVVTEEYAKYMSGGGLEVGLGIKGSRYEERKLSGALQADEGTHVGIKEAPLNMCNNVYSLSNLTAFLKSVLTVGLNTQHSDNTF
jgi:hypothetical protein